MIFIGYLGAAPDPAARRGRGDLGAGWVTNKHLSIRSQGQEVINIVLSTDSVLKKEEQRTSNKRYRRYFAAWWPLYRGAGGLRLNNFLRNLRIGERCGSSIDI